MGALGAPESIWTNCAAIGPRISTRHLEGARLPSCSPLERHHRRPATGATLEVEGYIVEMTVVEVTVGFDLRDGWAKCCGATAGI